MGGWEGERVFGVGFQIVFIPETINEHLVTFRTWYRKTIFSFSFQDITVIILMDCQSVWLVSIVTSLNIYPHYAWKGWYYWLTIILSWITNFGWIYHFDKNSAKEKVICLRMLTLLKIGPTYFVERICPRLWRYIKCYIFLNIISFIECITT